MGQAGSAIRAKDARKVTGVRGGGHSHPGAGVAGTLDYLKLSESGLLALAGAVVGAALAAFLSRFLIAFISTPNNPIFLDIPTNWHLLGFTAGLAILTTVLFGLVPALHRLGRLQRVDLRCQWSTAEAP